MEINGMNINSWHSARITLPFIPVSDMKILFIPI